METDASLVVLKALNKRHCCQDFLRKVHFERHKPWAAEPGCSNVALHCGPRLQSCGTSHGVKESCDM